MPKLSILSEKVFSETNFTIIPGGGLFLNFYSKWFPTIVLPITTIAIIIKKITTPIKTFFEFFINYILPYSDHEPS